MTDHNCFGFRKHFFLWWWWWWWQLRHLTACSVVILREIPGILNPCWRDKNLGIIHHAYSHIQFNIYHQNGQIIRCHGQTFRPWYLCDQLLKNNRGSNNWLKCHKLSFRFSKLFAFSSNYQFPVTMIFYIFFPIEFNLYI